jgi:hypothetical protein
MQRREETMLIGGALLATVGLALVATGKSGIVLALVITAAGAALPVLDAWRREVVTR